jgi:hypothetical protein
MQEMGWRWIETYIWAKPNAVPGRFGPRTKDSFEYVYHFACGNKPLFDLDAIRVPYKADDAEIARRKLDRLGRRNTEAGFGRDRPKTYLLGGADPGNVVPQTYNQHRGVAHTAAMPEGLAEFFIQAMSPGRHCHRPVCRGRDDDRRGPAARAPGRWVRDPRGVRSGSSPADRVGHRRRCAGHAGERWLSVSGIEQTVQQVVEASSWDQRIAQVRLIPQKHGTGERQRIYAEIARRAYVPHLAPDFAYIHEAPFYDRPYFADMYAVVDEATDGLTVVNEEHLTRVLQVHQRTLLVLRTILGLTKDEFGTRPGLWPRR